MGSSHANSLALPCHIHVKSPSADNSMQFADVTTVELCLGLPSENAIKTQTWCAIATYVLIAVLVVQYGDGWLKMMARLTILPLFSMRYADVLPEVLFRKFYANLRRPSDCHIDVA